MNVQPFSPGPTVTLAVTTSTASATITAGFSVLRVVNAGTGLAFFRFGTGAQTAVITDTPILPSTERVFSIPEGATTVAAITGTGTATLYLTTGEGQ